MSKSRVIGAGAGIGRANGGGGYNTGGNQGGGNKKQGLIGTTNMRVGLVPYVRTRADGGNSRHWTFCMNQLGGVGRRWGQAAGPGNRGGVHALCKHHAHRSRQRHPRRPKQSSGYGSPKVYRSNQVVVRDPTPPPPPPDVAGYYGTYGGESPAGGIEWPTAVTLATLAKQAPAYNVLILGFVTFGSTTSGNLVLTTKWPSPGTMDSGGSQLQLFVENGVVSFADPVQIPIVQAFLSDLATWRQGKDMWDRPRKVLVSVGGTVLTKPPWSSSPDDYYLMPSTAEAIDDAARNLWALLVFLAAPSMTQSNSLDGVDLKITGQPDSEQLVNAAQILTALDTAHPGLTYNFSPLGVTQEQVADKSFASLVALAAKSGGSVALQCTEPPATSSLLFVCAPSAASATACNSAPGSMGASIWDRWCSDSPAACTTAPATWAEMGQYGAAAGGGAVAVGCFQGVPLQGAPCPTTAAAVLFASTNARSPADSERDGPWGLILLTAPQLIPIPTEWHGCCITQGAEWFSETHVAFQNLIDSYQNLLIAAQGGMGPPYSDYPRYLCGLSIQWDASPVGKDAWSFANAAKTILDNGWAPTGPTYTVSGSAGNVFDGAYVRFTPTTSQPGPTLPTWAQSAYVQQDSTDPTATPTLYAKDGGPHWILGEVDLTTGTLNDASATNPVVWSFCTTQCSTPPHAGWQGVAGAVAVTVTPNT